MPAVLKRKALALFMSVVLAFSMTSAVGLSAFAEQDSTLKSAPLDVQSSNQVVYDSVYGVMAGEYALMMKSVTYEKVYGGKTVKYTDTVTDVVKADGKVTIHTNNFAENVSAMPGSWTNEEFSSYRAEPISNGSSKVASGYAQVKDKTTGKVGVKSFDNGAWLVPASYDNISDSGYGFIGFNFADTSLKVAFLSYTGDSQGSTSMAIPKASGWKNAYASMHGNYVVIRAYVDGSNYTSLVKKDESKYVPVPDVSSILYEGSGSEFLAVNNGSVYYYSQAVDGALVASASGVENGYIDGSFISLTGSSSTSYYGVSGSTVTPIRMGSRSGHGTVGGYLLAFSHGNGMALFAPSGTVAFEDSSSDIYDVEALGAQYYAVTTAETSQEVEYYDEDEDEFYDDADTSYHVRVFSAPHALKADLGTFGGDPYLSTIYNYYSTPGSVIGYELYDYESSATRYYDAEFNEVSTKPEAVSASSSGQLMFGTTPINASVQYNYDGGPTYISKVTDAQGNPVVRNGYTLGIAIENSSYASWNRVKHGNADIWWAQDSKGNWGAIDSSGAVKVPFVYESYYDGGRTDTDYALVKSSGVWRFYNVKTNAVTTPGSSDGASGGSSSVVTKPTKTNPMKVKAKTPKVKRSKLVKKKQVIKASAAYKFTKKAVGTLTYAKVSKGSSKHLSVNKKTGAITVKKGLKKNTYKVKVKITAAGNATYKPLSKTVTVKVKVK